MKYILRSAFFAVIVSLAVALSACSNDMNAGQYTFACDEQNPCADGFFCGPNGVCVEDGADVSAQEDTTDATDTTDTEDAEDTASDTHIDTEDTEQDSSADTSSDASDADDTTDAEDTDTGDACEAQTWYRDCDDDGYAGLTAEACERPRTSGGDCPIDGGDPEQRWKSASEIANTSGEDCDDNDPRAFPGQTQFFSTERERVGGFDFNCDTTETPKWEKTAGRCIPAGVGDLCGLEGDRCNLPDGAQGWDGPSFPVCGDQGTWITDCQSGCHDSCNDMEVGSSRTQACR